jgi:hypothetical protein
LTVDAGGTPIYFVTGTATQVSANTTVLNSTLAAFGFGFYQFSSLSGASNFPGTAQSANLILSGTITGVPGGSGAGLPLTIRASEPGFTLLPSSGPPATLFNSSTANFTNANVGDSQVSNSSFNTTLSTPPLLFSFNGFSNPQSFAGQTSIGVPGLTPSYELGSSIVLHLSAGSIEFSAKTHFVPTVIPEPPPLVLLGTGLLMFTAVASRRLWRRA